LESEGIMDNGIVVANIALILFAAIFIKVFVL